MSGAVRFKRASHRQPGLSGPGGTDAEGQIARTDLLHVAALVGAARAYADPGCDDHRLHVFATIQAAGRIPVGAAAVGRRIATAAFGAFRQAGLDAGGVQRLLRGHAIQLGQRQGARADGFPGAAHAEPVAPA